MAFSKLDQSRFVSDFLANRTYKSQLKMYHNGKLDCIIFQGPFKTIHIT